MRLLEWAAESPAVTTCAYKRVTGRTVELGLAQVKAGCKTPVRKKGGSPGKPMRLLYPGTV